jgi:hypothetical protein
VKSVQEFIHGPRKARKNRLLDFLEANGAKNPSLPPQYVKHRWSSFLDAAEHLLEIFDLWPGFIAAEKLIKPDSKSVKLMIEAMGDDAAQRGIKLAYVLVWCACPFTTC